MPNIFHTARQIGIPLKTPHNQPILRVAMW